MALTLQGHRGAKPISKAFRETLSVRCRPSDLGRSCTTENDSQVAPETQLESSCEVHGD